MRVVAAALEQGRWNSVPARILESVWSRLVRVDRPVHLPDGVRVVGVAGPVLGGSYVTPTLESLARALDARGARVAIVAHGYRSQQKSPRRVRDGDTAARVGDEARQLATALRGVPVIVGRPRALAVAEAARFASLIVADALLQTTPRRLTRSLLVVDAEHPWGAGRCPPCGDLRAPLPALLSLADDVLVVHPAGHGPATGFVTDTPGFAGRIHYARGVLCGAASMDGESRSLEELRALRVGLVLGIARPERVRGALLANGIRPVTERFFADHASGWRFRYGARFRAHPVDLWLTTAKCATKLGSRYCGAPLFVLDHRVELPDGLILEVAESAACAATARAW